MAQTPAPTTMAEPAPPAQLLAETGNLLATMTVHQAKFPWGSKEGNSYPVYFSGPIPGPGHSTQVIHALNVPSGASLDDAIAAVRALGQHGEKLVLQADDQSWWTSNADSYLGHCSGGPLFPGAGSDKYRGEFIDSTMTKGTLFHDPKRIKDITYTAEPATHLKAIVGTQMMVKLVPGQTVSREPLV